ncbi:MAG: hypothetical protein IIC00_08745 [Planctomycetes bacterium]|nr:hypothetical protein [Planctomycetota bacterium]
MNPKKKDSNPLNFSEVYKRYCHELDKEDKLLNDRVTWLLVSQSILFAAVKLGGNRVGEDKIIIIALLGCALSIIIWFSVLAAIYSFLTYRSKLIDYRPKDDNCRKAYPQLDRCLVPILFGFFAPFTLPIIFFHAWLWIIQRCFCA